MNYLDDEDDFEKNAINPRKPPKGKPRGQQTQMDEYLFKARRIDKGAREFGLRTIHEPKRGSKKKRQSTDALEVVLDVEEVNAIKKKMRKEEEEVENDWRRSSRKTKEPTIEDDLDYSSAFHSPSPRRPTVRRRNTKITKFMIESPKTSKVRKAPAVTSNKPSAFSTRPTDDYSLDSTLDSTSSLLRTPPRALIETIPLCTPSPAAKRKYYGELEEEEGKKKKKEPPVFKWDVLEQKKNRNSEQWMDGSQTIYGQNATKNMNMTGSSGYSSQWSHSWKPLKNQKIDRIITPPIINTSTNSSSSSYLKNAKIGKMIPPLITDTSSAGSSAPTAHWEHIKKPKMGKMIPPLITDTTNFRSSSDLTAYQQLPRELKIGKMIPQLAQKTSSSAPETLNDPSTSSFQYTPDDECEIVEKPRHHRNALSAEATERETFGRRAADRQQMMRQLVDRQFLAQREHGATDGRKAELRDGQVIRNKEMRRNLMHGAACKCCRGYYDGLVEMEEKEKNDYIDKVSRHRYVHQALPDTPERYWDLTLGPCDDLEVAPKAERVWGRTETQTEKKDEKKTTGIRNWE